MLAQIYFVYQNKFKHVNIYLQIKYCFKIMRNISISPFPTMLSLTCSDHMTLIIMYYKVVYIRHNPLTLTHLEENH